jgi:hypothetical protein
VYGRVDLDAEVMLRRRALEGAIVLNGTYLCGVRYFVLRIMWGNIPRHHQLTV